MCTNGTPRRATVGSVNEPDHPRSSPRYDRLAPILVLSPHFDDAVFNQWSLLDDERLDVEVVNVFGGVPAPGIRAAADRDRDVADSAQFIAQRVAEDARALALAGRRGRNLDFLEHRFRVPQVRVPRWVARAARRPGRRTVNVPLRRDHADIRAQVHDAVAQVADAWSLVCAPAGIGGHPDHHVVRDVALRFAAEGGMPVRLYADLPYACARGWPRWLGGSAPAALDDAIMQDWSRTATLGSPELLPDWRDATTVVFDETSTQHKERAVAAYVTQFAHLDDCFQGRMRMTDTWTREAYWCVTSS